MAGKRSLAIAIWAVFLIGVSACSTRVDAGAAVVSSNSQSPANSASIRHLLLHTGGWDPILEHMLDADVPGSLAAAART